MKQTFLLGAVLLAVSMTSNAPAMAADQKFRVGILSNAPQSVKVMEKRLGDFRKGLLDLGYVEGRNVEFHNRYPATMANRAVQQAVLAKELVALNPHVIFTFSSPATDSVQKATRTIPIVVGVSVDRFVNDFSRPDGNITGLSSNSVGVLGKQLQIFREAVPKLHRVAVLWNPQHRAHKPSMEKAKEAAATLGLTLVPVAAAKPSSFAEAFQTMAESKVDGVLILRGGMFVNSRPKLSDLANKFGIPSMFGHPVEAKAGGLISYGTNVSALFRRAAHYVDKILKGAKPSDLPVERPTQFDLVINARTAQKLGLSVPPTLLLRATEVIE